MSVEYVASATMLVPSSLLSQTCGLSGFRGRFAFVFDANRYLGAVLAAAAGGVEAHHPRGFPGGYHGAVVVDVPCLPAS